MEIGPRFPGSDDVITSGKITLSESEKIETERRMQIENSSHAICCKNMK